MPFFSVVMPLFNKAAFVVDSVRSVLTQDFSDLELIVVDDGSTDNSVERLAILSDPRLHIIRQPNAGVSAARNRGIQHASGSYVAFLDADDLWSPQHLVQISELIAQDQFAIAWATGYSEFDHAVTTPQVRARPNGCASVPSGSYDQPDFLMAWARFPFFWTGSISIRASTLRTLQPCFPIGERLGEDQDLWYRVSELGPIRFSNQSSTAFYRRGIGNSLTAPAVLTPLPAVLRLRDRSGGQSPRIARAVRHVVSMQMLHVAWANCLAGRRDSALRFLVQADPLVAPIYWLRVFAGLMVPTAFARAARSWIKSNRARRTGEL